MQQDDFASFRAQHPSAIQAIRACGRPDWVIRIGFAATRDRRFVLRTALNAARMLNATKYSSLIDFLRPYPGPLEPVAKWLERDKPRFTKVRSLALGAIAAGVPTYVADRFVSAPRLGNGSNRLLLLNAMLLVFALLFAVLIERRLKRQIVRQAASLNDEVCLQILLAQVTAGAARNPRNVPITMKMLVRHIGDDLETK